MDYPKADRDAVNKLAVEAKTDPSLIPRLWYDVQGFIRDQAKRRRDRLESIGGDYHQTDEIDDYVNQSYFQFLKAIQGYNQDRGSFTTCLGFYIMKAFAEVDGVRTSKRDAILFSDSLDVPANDALDHDGETKLETVVDPSDPFEDVDCLYFEDLHRALQKALDALPKIQRETIKGIFIDGLTGAEMARQRGVITQAVNNAKSRGLESLRRIATAEGLERYLEANTLYYRHYGIAYMARTNTSPVEAIVLDREKIIDQWKNETYFAANDGRKD